MLSTNAFSLLAAGLPDVIDYEIIQGNPLWRFAALLVVLLTTLAAARTVQFIIQGNAAKRTQKIGTNILSLVLESLAKPTYIAVLSLGLYICKLCLFFNDQAGIRVSIGQSWLKIVQLLAAIAVAYALYRLVDVAEYYLGNAVGKTETVLDDMLVPVVRKSLRITIAIISALLIAENIFGAENIKSLLFSAGVGGIAIALAAKDTIANFFGSITIFADRPFHINDMVKIGDYFGPIEEVGFRSTRLRTLEGHLITIPNSVMANEKIENVGNRPFIRRTATITITYDSGFDKTQRAVEIIKDVLADTPQVNTDADRPFRVYFSDFGNCSLNIYVSYWVKPPDYWVFKEVNEKINFEILKRFDAEGIEFAFPTQTLYLKKAADNID